VLFGARDAAARGERDAEKLAAKIGCELADAGIRVEYVNVVDPQTMTPVAEALRGTAIAAAVRIGTTRLIDNVLVP
jgi:pantothenate synthetase